MNMPHPSHLWSPSWRIWQVVALVDGDGAPALGRGRRRRSQPGLVTPATTSLAACLRAPAPGPVTVEGTTEPSSAKVTELIAFVALHPGTSDERIKAALWPDRTPSPGTFHNTVSAARRVLATGKSGPRFPAAEASRYRLSDEVEVDWLRLEEALCSDDRSALQAPLGLVRGSPFGAKSGYEWAHEVGLSHAAAADVARAARAVIAKADSVRR